jgi:hypothetical protein
VDIAAASFSIYAYQLLKKELEQIDELNFLFTGEVFTNEQAPAGLPRILYTSDSMPSGLCMERILKSSYATN